MKSRLLMLVVVFILIVSGVYATTYRVEYPNAVEQTEGYLWKIMEVHEDGRLTDAGMTAYRNEDGDVDIRDNDNKVIGSAHIEGQDLVIIRNQGGIDYNSGGYDVEIGRTNAKNGMEFSIGTFVDEDVFDTSENSPDDPSTGTEGNSLPESTNNNADGSTSTPTSNQADPLALEIMELPEDTLQHTPSLTEAQAIERATQYVQESNGAVNTALTRARSDNADQMVIEQLESASRTHQARQEIENRLANGESLKEIKESLNSIEGAGSEDESKYREELLRQVEEKIEDKFSWTDAWDIAAEGIEGGAAFSGYSSLFMSDESLAKWRNRVDELFSSAMLGIDPWTSKMCEQKLDVPSGQQVSFSYQGNQIQIAATCSGTIQTTKTNNDTIYLYKIGYYLTNPSTEDILFNVKLTGTKTTRIYTEKKLLKAGESDSLGGAASIIQYSTEKYTKCCIEGTDHDICNTITSTSTDEFTGALQSTIGGGLGNLFRQPQQNQQEEESQEYVPPEINII